MLDGGAGVDEANYADSDDHDGDGVTVNLTTGKGSYGHAAGDTLTGIENIRGSAYRDKLIGDDSDNRLYGGKSDDTLEGGGGDDTLEGGAGVDVLEGGLGTDEASYASSDAGVTVDLSLRDTKQDSGGHAKGDTLTGIENIRGSKYNDTLTGDDSDNRLYGGGGIDVLRGGKGDDTLEGGADADVLDGGGGVDEASYADSDVGVMVNLTTGQGSGGHATGDTLRNIENIRGSEYNDTLTGDHSSNRLDGGAGDDTLAGGVGADEIDGGAGVDEASYVSSNVGVTVNLSLRDTKQVSYGHAAGDTLTGIENIRGSAHDDLLKGDDVKNVIKGGAGNDRIYGQGGDDTLEGGAGADNIRGGAGVDEASYVSSNVGVTVNLTLMTGQVGDGHAAGDTLTGIENIRGSAHNDVLRGDNGDNVIKGGAGDDKIYGLGGKDTLEGGAGNDIVQGGADRDIINGGAGKDVFVFQDMQGRDTITDFEVGTDTIRFRGGFNKDEDDRFGKLTFDDLTIKDKGDDAMITWAGADVNSITLQGVDHTLLTGDDFEFL